MVSQCVFCGRLPNFVWPTFLGLVKTAIQLTILLKSICTLRNHNRSTALERSVIDYWGA